jgi:hypothetical protein
MSIVLELFSFGVPPVAAVQEVVFKVPPGLDIVADVVVPDNGGVLLGLGDLEVVPEVRESIVDVAQSCP